MPLTSLDSLDPTVRIRWRVATTPQRLWAGLTEPRMLGLWLGTLTSGSIAPDASFVVDHGDGYACRSTVRSMRTPFSLGYSWRFPDEQDTDVTWGLEEDGDGTVLTMSHAGLGGLSHSYRDGWLTHLTFLEAAVIGHPLPRDMFWPLHGTFAALHPTGTDPA